MSDVMLLAVLRMPVEHDGGPWSPVGQLISRARQSADRIEADAAARDMFVERLKDMGEQGCHWITVQAVLSLLNECYIMSAHERGS